MKGVFEISGASRYDDFIAERYHFPRIYLRAAEACVGDWIVYRETGSAGGRKAYVAAGLVQSIDPDPADRTLFYARISDFIEFDRPVPYRDPDGRFLERMLRELDNPAIAGRALRGRSVRAIDDADFADIVNRGLVDTLSPEHAIRLGSRSWRPDDGAAGEPFSVQVEDVGSGADLAVFINATHDVTRQGAAHLAGREDGIGRTISFTPKIGPGPRSLAGGTHAANLADQITREIRATRSDEGVVHLFAACPNSLLFFLGQQHGGIAPVVIYEFDFDRQGDRGYHASFVIA